MIGRVKLRLFRLVEPVKETTEAGVEKDCSHRERDDETNPHADRPHSESESAKQAHGQRYDNISNESIDHRPSDISQSA